MTILGTPAEIYNFGTQYWITIISILFSGIVVATVYLPVFTTLQLNSVYEVRPFCLILFNVPSNKAQFSRQILSFQYLEIRFSRAVRILISSIFVFDVVSPHLNCSRRFHNLFWKKIVRIRIDGFQILYQSIVVYVPALALNQGIL